MKIYYLCFGLFVLYSCQQVSTTDAETIEVINDYVAAHYTKIEPLPLAPVVQYFYLINDDMSDWLYNTNDSIRNTMLPDSIYSYNRMKIEQVNESGLGRLELLTLLDTMGNDILCLIEQIERSNTISVWQYVDSTSSFNALEGVLPRLTPDMCIESEMPIPEDAGSFHYSMVNDSTIQAALITQMNPIFEMVQVYYHLHLIWTETTFRIEQIPIREMNLEEQEL